MGGRLPAPPYQEAARTNGLNYSQFISGLKRSNIALDRKVLAEIAVADPGGFKAVVDAID